MNWTAISMFMVFVCFTLLVTRWAALRTRSASDFYTAGGGLTGMQNGLAIAGDMISAASFLGISAMMFMNGYDGLLYLEDVAAGSVLYITTSRGQCRARVPASSLVVAAGARPRRSRSAKPASMSSGVGRR